MSDQDKSLPGNGEPLETVSESETRAIMEKVDKESTHRNLRGWQATAVAVLALGFSFFQIWTALFGTLDAQLQRAVHLLFVLVLVYLLYPFRKKARRDRLHLPDLLPVALTLFSLGYLILFYQDLVLRSGMPTTLDVVVGTIGVLLVFEAARRIIGLPMVIIAAVFVVYAFYGETLPGVLAHRNVRLAQLVTHLWFTTEGVFGIPLGVSSTFVFMFLLFAAFIEITGVGKLFIDLGNWLAGWASGGPAKVAVITSALEGMVEGSSVSNVVGSGSFTIPMMKKLGYRREFAGAVEAAASTGGQLMPPIMGAAAFLMAEYLGIPYLEVAKAAAIPAVLYFTGIFAGVHFEAKKLGLRGLPRRELPKFLWILRKEGINFIPLIAIIILLTASGFSLLRVALLATASAVIAPVLLFLMEFVWLVATRRGPSWFEPATGRKATPALFAAVGVRTGVLQLLAALQKGARSALGVATACALAGVIVGVVTKTGLGFNLAHAVLAIAGKSLLLTMFFTMITSLILGMGVPTTANYIITSTIAAPTLLGLGVIPMAAHLFVFYFGIIADLTPPVALAAYAGAAIARGNPFRTGLTATRLAIGAFILPYIFVMAPELLLFNVTADHLIRAIFTSLLGMTSLSAALAGYLIAPLKGRWGTAARVLLAAGGLGLVDPGLATDLIGIAVLALVVLVQALVQKRRPARTAG